MLAVARGGYNASMDDGLRRGLALAALLVAAACALALGIVWQMGGGPWTVVVSGLLLLAGLSALVTAVRAGRGY